VLFFEDFSDPASFDRFDTISWARDRHLGGGLDEGVSFEGDHAPVAGGNDPDNCTGPFETRTLGRATKYTYTEEPTDHVYRCAPGDDPAKAHLMVAQGPTSGYDFAAAWTKETFSGATEIRWEQNVTDLGGRNWSEVKLVPAANWNPVQPPCSTTWVPCFTDVSVGGTGGEVISAADSGSVIVSWARTPEVVTPVDQDDDTWHFRSWVPYSFGSARDLMEQEFGAFSSPAPRYTHILTDNGDGTITLSIDTQTEAYGVHEAVTLNGSFPQDFHLVFATHDYTSGKSDGAYDGKTWHFDNISVS
jgi:hypothetical protein